MSIKTRVMLHNTT